jgi:hypothetical protein
VKKPENRRQKAVSVISKKLSMRNQEKEMTKMGN